MKDPSLCNLAPNMTINEEVILSSLSEENPFAEYMWMENEEEFNRQVEEELWEEEFIENCFQEMLEEEQWEWFIPSRDLPPQTVSQLQEQINQLVLEADGDFEIVIQTNTSTRLIGQTGTDLSMTRAGAVFTEFIKSIISCCLSLFSVWIQMGHGHLLVLKPPEEKAAMFV